MSLYPLPTAGSHRGICSGLVIDFEEVVRRAAGGILFALALNVVGPVHAQPRAGRLSSQSRDESGAVTHCLLAQRLNLLGYSTQIGRLRRRNLVEFSSDHLHELASDSRDKGFESGGVHKRIRNADW